MVMMIIIVMHIDDSESFIFQMILSTFSIVGGFLIYYLDLGTAKECIIWPAASAMIASIIPYTLIGMMPLNYQLLETEKCIEKGKQCPRE